MPTYSPAQVAQQVLNQGGSKAQAWVAAALVDGIESSGNTTAKNPTSTACGLFQFLTTTWLSNGGGAYAPTACDATLQQQVAIFLKASAGNNFYPWVPDLGGAYNGNGKQPAAIAPQPGSPVANKIASLAAGGTLGAILGNVPNNWADAGAATATSGAGSLVPGGGSSSSATPGQASNLSQCVIQLPGFLFFSGPCFLTKGGVKWLSGVAALMAGTAVGMFGVVLLAASVGKSTGATAAVRKAASILPGPVGSVAKAAPSTSSGGSVSRGTSEPERAGRLESRRIERRYEAAQEDQGPIGPRGGSSTSQRVAREQRQGTSYTPTGRQGRPTTTEIARRRARAKQPF